MNNQEAWTIVATLRAGSAAQQLEDDRLELWVKHLEPLSFERTALAARRWIVARSEAPKFLSSVDDVLTAVGVPGAARDLVMRAAWEGGAVHPALEGWVYVAPDAVLPPGVAGLARLQADLAEDARRALPAGPIVGPAQRKGLRARIDEFATKMLGPERNGWE